LPVTTDTWKSLGEEDEERDTEQSLARMGDH